MRLRWLKWPWARREDEPDDRETTLCRMVGLRRKADPVLRRKERPEDWPMAALWETPEAFILEAVSLFLTLREDGLTEAEALARLDVYYDGGEQRRLSTFQIFLKDRLKERSPTYLELGPALLNSALAIAERAARHQIAAEKSRAPYPPTQWLQEQIELADVESRQDLFRLRMVEGDELWRYFSPADAWRQMAGRGGVVLLRNGRSILDEATIMN